MSKHILTTILLVLTLSTYAAAQGNIDGFKDWNPGRTVQGVGEIGLIVKYGQVDGLEASMRPVMLKTLHDRARELLTQGKVPLLEATDEAEMVDKPRLIFIVNVKKQTDPGPRLNIETKIVQRVSLWRDPAQVIELPTWDWNVDSAQVDYASLSSFFDMQVKLFIKVYNEENSKPAQVENRKTELPPLKGNANSLEGLKAIDFSVGIAFFETADERLNRLWGPLRNETEAKLKQAGISLLRRSDAATAGYPLLNVKIHLNPNGVSYAPAIQVRSEFFQRVCRPQDPKQFTYIPTWLLQTSDDSPITEEAIRKMLNSHLDQFIEAYKAANAKSQSFASKLRGQCWIGSVPPRGSGWVNDQHANSY